MPLYPPPSASSGGLPSYTPVRLSGTFTPTGSYGTITGMSWTINETGWFEIVLDAIVSVGATATGALSVGAVYSSTSTTPTSRVMWNSATGGGAANTWYNASSNYIDTNSYLASSNTIALRTVHLMNITASGGTMTLQCLRNASTETLQANTIGYLRKF